MECGDKIDASVRETVESARDYQLHLKELLSQLDIVEAQVQTTAAKSTEAITCHFSQLTESLVSLLERRHDALLAEVAEVTADSATPLAECRHLIENKLLNAKLVEEQGEQILKSKDSCKDQLISFCEKASLLGSLPEIPSPTNVANISVAFDGAVEDRLSAELRTYGCINVYSPVQICYTEDRPGALVVHWLEHEDDDTLQGNVFRLQHCHGDVIKHPEGMVNFRDVYRGSETNCIVRDLKNGLPYSFRVTCSDGSSDKWRPWSQPYVASTSLVPYEWSPADLYTLTHDGKIATRTAENVSGILYGKVPLDRCNHSLRFRVLEVGITSNVDEGIAIVNSRHSALHQSTFQQHGVIHINMQGVVFVDGHEISSRLPPLKRNSYVIFDIEMLPNNSSKIRVMVESGDRQVTYDWLLPKSATSGNLGIYFALFCRCDGWKIVVD